jgi:hypothetical protein
MSKITSPNSSNGTVLPPPNVDLERIENLRTICNGQKIATAGRFGIVNSTFATYLEADDRVKSALFYKQLNGDYGLRRWKNLAGFSNIWEYPALQTTGNLCAFFGDRRAILFASRPVQFSNAAEELGVPQVMEFREVRDPESGLTLRGVLLQEVGIGDVYVSCALLFGVTAGSQGGAPGAITDAAGLRVTSA